MLNTQLGERSAEELNGNMAAMGIGLLKNYCGMCPQSVSADNSTWDLPTTTPIGLQRQQEAVRRLTNWLLHTFTAVLHKTAQKIGNKSDSSFPLTMY